MGAQVLDGGEDAGEFFRGRDLRGVWAGGLASYVEDSGAGVDEGLQGGGEG